jgi:hypothetical protein
MNTPDDIRLRFPEFADLVAYPDARIQLFIDDTACHMGADETRWFCYDAAQAYLVAHLLTIGTATESGSSSATSGPITSKSAGGVSVTRAAVVSVNQSVGDGFYSSTAYGQQFLMYRNRSFVGVRVANWPQNG